MSLNVVRQPALLGAPLDRGAGLELAVGDASRRALQAAQRPGQARRQQRPGDEREREHGGADEHELDDDAPRGGRDGRDALRDAHGAGRAARPARPAIGAAVASRSAPRLALRRRTCVRRPRSAAAISGRSA